MFYFVKTPWLLKKYYGSCTWDMPGAEKKLYLTFDDGPHPEATPFVLDELKKYNARATFFCIGKNVVAYPKIYKRILEEGHRTGNHTHDHLNGWKVADELYFKNIHLASTHIDSKLFRPPYGRISRFQVAGLTGDALKYKIIMWDVLSGDFDQKLSPEKCAAHVISNAQNGSIIVFHDSAKAMERMQKSVMETLKFFAEKGYKFEAVI